VVDWQARVPLFRQMLKGISLRRVLEVGCNRGHNLAAISELLGPRSFLVGVEPNASARAIARETVPGGRVIAGDAAHLPFRDGSFDFVFTWGVLIHVSLEGLGSVLAEANRLASRYILAVEYFAKEETPIQYRGRDDLLWKRDFLRHYQGRFSELALVNTGFWGRDRGADDVTWWLLEKRRTGRT
jgi:pseudaminic acid biosynthesis-associated methylase